MSDKNEFSNLMTGNEINARIDAENKRIAEVIKRRNRNRKAEDKVIALFGLWEVHQDGTICGGNYNPESFFGPGAVEGHRLAEGNWPLYLAHKAEPGNAILAYFFALRHLGIKEVTLPTAEIYTP